MVKLGTIKWSGSRHPLNGPRFYSNAISSCESEHDFEEIISKIETPDIGNGEDKFKVEVSLFKSEGPMLVGALASWRSWRAYSVD